MKPGDLDLCDIANYNDGVPLEYLDMLRREDPVHWHPETDGKGFWAITKHADLVHISKHPKLFSSWLGGTNLPDRPEEDLAGMRAMLLNMDPPQHVKYRRLVQRGFTPRMVKELEPRIRQEARGVVDRVATKGECDFVQDLASELPLILICELMGVPVEDRHKIFDWSNKLIGFDDPEFQHSASDGKAAAMELWMYANAIAQQKKANPDDTLISKLINGSVDGEQLTEMEFNNFAVLLSVAGNETTRTVTTHGMRLLCEHPDQRDKLVQNLDRLLPTAVEEFVRYNPPVIHFRRTATEDTEIRGQRISAGDKVVMFYPAANRDEEVFENPTQFDVARDPNPHVGFGIGEHYCLGANLARMTLECIFREILTRIPDIQLAGPVKRLRGNFVDGIKEMRVSFTPET
ncbi:MAG: cytochrome P450 [Proteobacteria bacterium]|nr:cytochrome P450 [Pseudomonadota bacterium]